MLFDLRSRGRRRTVQVVYLGLALLMGGGLVLFGVGTGNGIGGLLNAFTGSGSSGGQNAGGQPAGEDRAQADQAEPQRPRRLGGAVRPAGTTPATGSNYDSATNTFTAAGKKELAAYGPAWQRYLTLTKNPDPTWRSSPPAPTPRSATTPARPAPGRSRRAANPTEAKGYECLAVSAYAAKQTRKGDLAPPRPSALVPKAEPQQLKSEIAAGQDQPTSTRGPPAEPSRDRRPPG